MPLPTCKSSFFGGTRKFIVSTSRDQRDRPPGWTLPDSSFSLLCACPRRHPRAHTASRPRVLRSGLQMRDPWVDARRGHRSRRRSCHGTDTAFPAPGLSLPKCCSLIIGKRGACPGQAEGPDAAGERGSQQGYHGCSVVSPFRPLCMVVTHSPLSRAPWLGCRPHRARPLVLFSARDKAWTSGPSTP